MAALVAVVDQVSKWWILDQVMVPPRVIPVTGFFNLVLGWNRGVSFGLFNSDSPYNALVFAFLAMVIIGVLMVWLWRSTDRPTRVAIGLIVGGAVGNVIDRLQFGAVVDFLDFHAFGQHWPAFNVADSGIVVGAVVLVASSLFQRPDRPKK